MTDVKTPEIKPLTPGMLLAIGFIEEHWHRYNNFPTLDKLKSKFPDFNFKEAFEHETFRLALNNRGITVPINTVNPEVPTSLTQEQLAAILTVVDWNNPKPRHIKLKELGISQVKWYGWLKNSNFKSFLHEMSTTNLHDQLNVAHEGIYKAIDRGDINAIKFYLEATGRYTQQTATTQNLQTILAKIVESIQRHIKNPEILRSIALDFEAIMKGEDPPVEQMQLERLI